MGGCDYIKTPPGIVKLVEEILNLTAIIIIAVEEIYSKRSSAFLGCAASAFVITGILLIIYLAGGDGKINWPWVEIQLGYCILWIIFYIVTSGLLIDQGIDFSDLFLAAGVVGLVAAIVYIVDAVLKIKKQG